MLGIYSKRMEKTLKILRLLALHGQLYQKQLAQMVGTSYRNLIRQLQLLQKAGLIQISRKEPSSKKGKEQNIWDLTFLGLIAVLRFGNLSEEEIDLVAQKHKNSWIIFQEWDKLTNDNEVATSVRFGLKRAIFQFTTPEPFVKGWDLKEHIKMVKQYPNFYNECNLDGFLSLMELVKEEAALITLRVREVFEFGEWFGKYEQPPSSLVKLWAICAKTPALKTLILTEIERQKEKIKSIKEFEKLFKYLAEEGGG